MKKQLSVAALCAALSLLPAVSKAAGFTDTFNGPGVDPAWGVDRYLPGTVDIQTVGGQSALHLGVDSTTSAANRPPAFSSTFYNYQGIQRSTNGLSGLWTVTGQIYVSPDMQSNLTNVGLWLRTGLVGDESTADYNILAFRNPGSDAGFYSWDDVTGEWIQELTGVGNGWHDLKVAYNGLGVQYSIDGTLLRDDTSIANPAYANSLTTVFAEAYNYGDHQTDGYFDNINAHVPDASSTMLLVGAGLLGLVFLNRRIAPRASSTA